MQDTVLKKSPCSEFAMQFFYISVWVLAIFCYSISKLQSFAGNITRFQYVSAQPVVSEATLFHVNNIGTSGGIFDY